MKDISRIKSDDFEDLLGWLSDEREAAGAEYVKIREGLIRFFRFKGCADSPTLADETINRVAAKIRTLDESKNVKKITIFYGFAAKIFLEYLRTSRRQNEKLNAHSSNQKIPAAAVGELSDDARLDCLKECLGTLSAEDRQIFLEYYGQEKEKKSEARKKIAGRLNCEMNALHVRVFRLRTALARCIGNCLKKSL